MKINLTRLAKRLRSRQTDAEKILRYKICNRQLEGVKFRRQQQIGNYIVDFTCFERRIIVEVDGGQHNEPTKEVKDEIRAQYLQQKGYRILRYWDNEVLQNIDGVAEDIRKVINENHPHLTSPVKGEE